MLFASAWSFCCIIFGVPCARALAPVEWRSLVTAPKASIAVLPATLPRDVHEADAQEGLPQRRGARLAQLYETNLTTSAMWEHSHSKNDIQKQAVVDLRSMDAKEPRHLHLMSINSSSKKQRRDKIKHKYKGIDNWQEYAPMVSMVLMAGVTPLFIGICLLLVIRMQTHRAEEDPLKGAAAQSLLASQRHQDSPGMTPIGKNSSFPTPPHFPSVHMPQSFNNVMGSMGMGSSPGHKASSPPAAGPGVQPYQVPSGGPVVMPNQVPSTPLQPNQISQVLVVEGSIVPKAQPGTTISIKNQAGDVVAKATFDEGRPGETELDGHHGILLEIPPRQHVAFLDTTEIHANQNPVVTVLPWVDPVPDPSAAPLATVQAEQHGGFEVLQGGRITYLVPMHHRNGTVTGVFENTGTGEVGRCLASFVAKMSAPGSTQKTVLNLSTGADPKLMLSVLFSILKLGGRVGREGALGSAADVAQKLYSDISSL